jgi:putative oxidoreductase
MPSRSAPDGVEQFKAQLLTTGSDLVLLLARVLIGVIFVRSGFEKILALGTFATALARDGVPYPQVVSIIAAFVEFLGGIALVVGFQLRYTALLMVLFVIIATLLRHRYWEFADGAVRRAQDTNFYKNLAMIGGLLALFIAGGGRFGVDGLRRREPE